MLYTYHGTTAGAMENNYKKSLGTEKMTNDISKSLFTIKVHFKSFKCAALGEPQKKLFF